MHRETSLGGNGVATMASLDRSGPVSTARPGGYLRGVALAMGLAVLLPLAACSPPVASTPTQQPDAGCTFGLPVRQPPEAIDKVETKYLEEIIVCSNKTTGAMSLTNNSEMVWGFTDSFPVERLKTGTRSAEIAQFHNNIQPIYSNAFMTPGESLTVIGGAGALAWAIHPELSLAWTANAYVMGQFQAKSQAAVRTAMTEGSPTHKVVWDCTVAVFNAGAENLLTTPSYDPAQPFKDGWDLGNSTGECVDSWNSAVKEVGETKIPKWAEFSHNAGLALEPTAELGMKSTNLKNAAIGTRPLICATLHKGC